MSGSSLELSRALLRHLGFEFTPERLPELLEESVREERSLPHFLENVLTQERLVREERRVKTALKLSGLSLGKTLEEYDYAFQRGLNKHQLDLLATTEFAKRKENVLFLGPRSREVHCKTGGAPAFAVGADVRLALGSEVWLEDSPAHAHR